LVKSRKEKGNKSVTVYKICTSLIF